MKVDFRVRLEDGPYTLDWLQQTLAAMQSLTADGSSGSREWADALVQKLADRIRNGPYSRDWLDAYRKQAKLLNIGTVGIAEPLYKFAEFRDLYIRRVRIHGGSLGCAQRRWLAQVGCESFASYLSRLEEERKHWETDGIQLRIGIDCDYFPGEEDVIASVLQAGPWDYCVGTVRFVDGWGMHLAEVRERWRRMETGRLYSSYFDLVEQAIESRLFDVISRVDWLDSFCFAADGTSLLPYYQRVARALKRHDLAVEISGSAGFGGRRSRIALLEILAQHGVAVTLSSGVAYPHELGRHWEEASNLLKRAGIGSIAVFERRQRQMLQLV